MPDVDAFELSMLVEQPKRRQGLLDFAFLELDMLARDGIVFLDHHLLCHGARILLRHVKKSRARCAVEPNLDGGWLGHGWSPNPYDRA